MLKTNHETKAHTIPRKEPKTTRPQEVHMRAGR